MRVALLVASLIAVSTVAGCFGGGDKDIDSLTYTCPGGKVIDAADYADRDNLTLEDLMAKCPGSTTTRTTTSTPSAPNVLPTVSLKVMDDGGNATLVTLVDGNLTFDASNSTDSDGNITGVAVSVTDSNQTRTASLFDPVTKTFKTATFKFDRPGVVNVTLAVVDDRAGFVTNVSNVYVNQMVTTPANAIQSPQADLAARGSPMHDPCTGAEGPLGPSHTITDANYYQTVTVPVQANATFIVATSTEDVVMTICSPDGAPVSPELVEGTVTSDQPLPLPADATKNYKIAFYATFPQATTEALVVVHYEPAPVAAA